MMGIVDVKYGQLDLLSSQFEHKAIIGIEKDSNQSLEYKELQKNY